MIKHVNRQNISTTPFVATKAWELFNVENDSLVLVETSSMSPTDDDPIALDYIDYNTGTPLLNRDCDIALEQQDADMAVYEEGISGSGLFDPYTEPQNDDGTFKRLVYAQIYRAFYNTYKNPVEIFGVENIDFPLSKTDRYLADDFRMFNIPQHIFGDKVKEGSVQFFDTSLDDNVTIVDDKFQNLIAGSNLFSHIQEVRHIANMLLSGSAVNTCSVYTPPPPAGTITITVSQT